eukprot:scaffold224818_cov33-Tisochrysis_lutea.AAC.3
MLNAHPSKTIPARGRLNADCRFLPLARAPSLLGLGFVDVVGSGGEGSGPDHAWSQGGSCRSPLRCWEVSSALAGFFCPKPPPWVGGSLVLAGSSVGVAVGFSALFSQPPSGAVMLMALGLG